MSKVEERVTFYEDRGVPGSPEHFWRVEIKYANGEIFYKGWIQDFGDKDSLNAGPTVYPMNSVNYRLDAAEAHKREGYWEKKEFDPKNVTVREAKETDLDELIDLNFQNYFEGGYNRISAYQGLKFGVDETHTILCLELEGKIVGFLFVEWRIDPQGTRAAYFDSLYCAPLIQGHGLNAKLIEAGIEKAKEKGCQFANGVIMGDEDHNAKIVHVLEKSGFRETHRVRTIGPPLVFSQWYDVHVVLDLSRG